MRGSGAETKAPPRPPQPVPAFLPGYNAPSIPMDAGVAPCPGGSRRRAGEWREGGGQAEVEVEAAAHHPGGCR